MTFKRQLAAIFKFALEVFIATTIFFVVAIPALLLDWFVQWLSLYQVSPKVLTGLEWLETGIFGLDLILCVIYLIRSSVNLVRELWRH